MKQNQHLSLHSVLAGINRLGNNHFYKRSLMTKVHIVKAMVFSSSHVWMSELDHKEGQVSKN